MKELIDLNLYNSVFFDAETQKTSDDVGGWDHIPDMLVSVAVTFNIREGYMKWYEDSIPGLIHYLDKFDDVVTFNGDRFDFTLLTHYGDVTSLRNKSFDLFVWIQNRIGKRCKLEKLAEETLKITNAKEFDGLEAVKKFKEGKVMEVSDYCAEDVRLLHDLIAYARLYGYIKTYGKILNIGYPNLPIID